jgi:1-acyl-sn-glycerol-3-phosphate acyltransferase
VIWLRSFIFTAFLFLSILPYSLMVIVAGLLSGTYQYTVARHWATTNLRMLHKICGLTYTVEGLENIPRQNCVVYIKHQSVFETILPFTIFPFQSFVLKRELMWVPILGWALRFIQPIAIDRSSGGTAVKQVVRQGRERLSEGRWIIIFPEGTRMAPGKTRKYGLSGALLSTDTGRPVLPVAHNAGDFWRRRGLRKNAGTVRVIIGPPIDAAGRTPAEVNRLAQDWIESTMGRISKNYPKSSDISAKSV